MFSKRFLSSILLWAVLLLVIFCLDSLAAALTCCLLVTIALWEYYDMLEKRNIHCSKIVGIVCGVALSAGAWWLGARNPDEVPRFEIFLLVFFVLSLFIRQLVGKNDTDGIEIVGNTILGVMYIPLLFNFIPKIKFLYPDNPDFQKPLFIFYLIIVTKFCDTGAYLVGRLFGRHKFIPSVSPKKTWEGVLGGLVVAVIASVTTFNYLKPRIAKVGFEFHDALALGIILGVVSVIGDLVESLIKRETHVKDSGDMLPGIGGVLDLIDSLLFTAPALYAYLVLFV